MGEFTLNFFLLGLDFPKKFGIMAVLRFRPLRGLTDRRDPP